MAVIAGRNIGTNDLVIMGAGGLMFIDSFLPWYYGKYLGVSASSSGWNSGFGAWFSILLVVAVGVVAAVRVFGGRTLPAVGNGQVTWGFITAAVSALAVVIILLRWLTYPDPPKALTGASSGADIGTYIGLILAIVQTVFGYLAIVGAGERLPWQKTAGA